MLDAAFVRDNLEAVKANSRNRNVPNADPDRVVALDDERELHGGGYTWQGIVWSLIEMHMPEAADRLRDIGAEADNMYVYSADRELLERVAALFRQALADHRLLNAAIDHAGDEVPLVVNTSPPFDRAPGETVGLQISGTAHLFAADGSRVASASARLLEPDPVEQR